MESWTPDDCLRLLDHLDRCVFQEIFQFVNSYERPPKPPTIRNSYTRTLVLDTITKLSGTIGVTQKTMTFDTHVCQICEFEDIHPAS